MTDIRCEESGDCYLVSSKPKSDLIGFPEQQEEAKPIPQPKIIKRKRPAPKKKATRKQIKGRRTPNRSSTKKLTKRVGRISVGRKKVKKTKKSQKKTRR